MAKLSNSSLMASVIRVCRKCATKIFFDAPEGLCMGCVLETALGLSPDESVADGDSSAVAAYSAEAAAKAGSAKADDPGQREQASYKRATARAASMLGELGDYEL